MLFLVQALALSAPAAEHGRKLSYAQILAYSPGSQVTDHSNVDLDEKAMEAALGATLWADAKAIYTDGAHSKPTAVCSLVAPAALTADVAKKAPITFTSVNGDARTGKAYSTYAIAATSVSFTYPVSSDQVEPLQTQCYVGGLDPSAQSTLGCIQGSATEVASGLPGGESTITIGSDSYTATCTNKGKRTLQGFSTKAQATMYDCPKDTAVSYENGCPYTSYKPYYDYYGQYDYANRIILAGLDKTAEASLTHGNFDLTDASLADGIDSIRKEFVKKTSAYMSVWMYTIREFEDAIDDCTSGDLTANALSSGPVHAWDEGVGFYTGSLLKYEDLLAGDLPTLDGKGKMPYTLANKRCKNFKTCGVDGDDVVGEAQVNQKLFDLFHKGQHKLLVGKCGDVVPLKNQIVSQMTVPLVQGTLRYAYKVGELGDGLKSKAEGHVFAAALLPQLHACDPAVATLVQDETNIMSDNTIDFAAVKTAIESCYTFMGITCEEVGGLWSNGDQVYYTKAEPCVTPSPPPPPSPTPSAPAPVTDTTGMLIGIIIGAAVAVICACMVLYMFMQERAGKPVFTNLNNKAAA